MGFVGKIKEKLRIAEYLNRIEIEDLELLEFVLNNKSKIKKVFPLINQQGIFKFLINQSPLRIVVGASNMFQDGWVPTDINNLNISIKEDWMELFKENSIDAILAEHVWEHLTLEDSYLAIKNCYHFLRPNGHIRIAVPDGFHPSAEYIESVKPGGTGYGAVDHKVLYNYKTLSEILSGAGFRVDLVEYFDEFGNFHCKELQPEEMGLISRSSKYDERNKDGLLNYTSLIIDGWKSN